MLARRSKKVFLAGPRKEGAEASKSGGRPGRK